MSNAPFITESIERRDVEGGFSCGVRELDDYFAFHAIENDNSGNGRAYVLRFNPDESDALPYVLGFYTLNMALAESTATAEVRAQGFFAYPVPVAVIDRFAVDNRARGRHIGEALLMDALRRVVRAATVLGCKGVVVYAKDEAAKSFYANYDFVAVTHDAWPRRMFLPIAVVRAAFANE